MFLLRTDVTNDRWGAGMTYAEGTIAFMTRKVSEMERFAGIHNKACI